MKNLRRIRDFCSLLVGFASAALLARRWNRRFMLKTVCPEQNRDEPGKSRSGKKVVVAVLLDCQLETAWQQVLTGGLLEISCLAVDNLQESSMAADCRMYGARGTRCR